MAIISEKIRESFKVARSDDRDVAMLETVVKYISGDLVADTRNQLDEAYTERQRGEQPILPAPIPLVEFYADELGQAYSNGVRRKLLHPDTKEVDIESTKIFNDALREVGYDLTLHRAEKHLAVMQDVGILITHDLGKLDVRQIVSSDIYPLWDPESISNRTNQDAYLGYAWDLHEVQGMSNLFGIITADGWAVVTVNSQNTIQDVITEHSDNSITWPQTTLTAAGKPTGVSERPLQMLSILHNEMPVDDLLSHAEPAIFSANRLLNVQWSVLHDVFRWQAGSVPVLTVQDRNKIAPSRPVGVNMPIVLEALNEKAEFLQAPNNWEALTKFLLAYAQIVGLLKRMAPDDLAIDTSNAESGFAKTVANLPKLRAIDNRIKMLLRIEQRLYPRVMAVLVWLGVLDAKAKTLLLDVEFERLRIPVTVPERVQGEQHDLKTHQTTRTKLVSDRQRVSEAEAKLIVQENEEANKEFKESDIGASNNNGFGGMGGANNNQPNAQGRFAALVNANTQAQANDDDNNNSE